MRTIAAPLIACAVIATTLPLAGESSATSCNSADCLPNVAQGVVGGTPCTPRISFVFGLDSGRNTLVCSANGVWVPTGPLIGEAQVSLPCATPGTTAQERLAANTLEQQVPGIPLQCVGPVGASTWVHFDLPQ